MYVDQIIFSKFQGKYEKIKIIYIYIFKTVVTKKFIKDNLKKKKNFNSQWKNVRNFPHSKTNFKEIWYIIKKF